MLDATLRDISSKKPSDQIAINLQSLEKQYLNLSGKLSIGSRPAFAELSSQLRAMSESYGKGQAVTTEAATLYAARTKMLLASEMAMAAPTLQN
jgi:hypothetical protein